MGQRLYSLISARFVRGRAPAFSFRGPSAPGDTDDPLDFQQRGQQNSIRKARKLDN